MDLGRTGGLLPNGDGGNEVAQETSGVVDELPRGKAEDGEAGLAQTSVSLTLMGKRLRGDDVDEVGAVDAKGGRDARQRGERRLEEHGPGEISLNEEGAGERLVGRAGKGRGVVDYGADDAAIAHPTHAGELFLEVFPAESGTQSRVGGDEAVGESVVAGDVDNRAGLGNAAGAVHDDGLGK